MRPSETRRRKPRWGQRRRHGCQGTRRRSASAGSANHPGYRHRLRRGAGRWNRGCHQGQWRHDVAGDEPTPAADRGPIHDIEQRRGDDDIIDGALDNDLDISDDDHDGAAADGGSGHEFGCAGHHSHNVGAEPHDVRAIPVARLGGKPPPGRRSARSGCGLRATQSRVLRHRRGVLRLVHAAMVRRPY
jgi:hypothetical protein